MKKTKKVLSAVWLCLLLLTVLPWQAYAIDPIELDRDVTLTVHYRQDGKPMSGARFDIYRVADTAKYAEFTTCGDFAGFSEPVNELGDAKQWDALAEKLLTYAEDIKPTVRGKTDSEGVCVFEKLRPGLYLVVGNAVQVGKVTYTCKPFVICLPQRDADAEAWDYAVDAAPKAGVPNETPTTPEEPRLPQTGALWWPVPVLACAGLAALCVGAARRRNSEK